MWDFKWWRGLFTWEEELFQQFHNMLRLVGLDRNSTGCFSTKFIYNFLLRKASSNQQMSVTDAKAYKVLWKCKVPNKILTF